ncbi:MAG TPA: FAD:protein FMN transferase [Rhodothermales bacterium]|nr:FAD:protein FMN transferase [Rhodothermales bacterium]
MTNSRGDYEMNRRTFLGRAGLLGGALLAGTPFHLLARAEAREQIKCVERLYVSMGTVVRFQVYHADTPGAEAAIREASSLIARVHRLMSVQENDSELARWNRSARGLDMPFDELTAEALDEAFHFASVTNGRFDPTVGAAVQAIERDGKSISQPERVGEWDRENRMLSKPHPGIMLDLGGSAKGWAVDRAVEVLLRAGVSSALVNAGGDLRVVGAPPGETAWSIGIRDPRRPDELLGSVPLRDASIATSGGYEQAAGSTLVDPRDLSRVRFGGSASVVAPTCGMADCLATSLCVEPDPHLLPATTRTLLACETGHGFVTDASPELLFQPSIRQPSSF